MKRKIKSLLLVFGLLLVSNQIMAQSSDERRLNKNAIYGSIGSAGLYFTATAYYERIFLEKEKLAFFARGGFGGYATWGIGGNFALAEVGILTGTKKSHLEAALGANYFISGDLMKEVPVAGTLGYRWQKPKGHFIFRAGLAVPEAIYLGLGYSF